MVKMNKLLEFVEEKPFTTLFSMIGLIIGLSLPSGLEFFTQNLINITDPQVLENFIVSFPISMFVKILSGLITTLFGFIVGLVIDSLRE